jgi:hypothetical protein
VRNGSQLRKDIYRMNDPRQVLDVVDRFFEEQLASAA